MPSPKRRNSPRLSFDPDCEPILHEGYDDARAISGFGPPTFVPDAFPKLQPARR